MTYSNCTAGNFLSRPNRFIAHVEIEGRQEVCHVKNTGRCRELLLPGATVFLHAPGTPNRKTKYDLIAVKKGNQIINMDAQAPNQIAAEWLSTLSFSRVQREVPFLSSRFDFYLEKGEKRIFAEVKGVTLEQDGLTLFPDAPTQRGVKHLRELIRCRQMGYEAWVIFIIQMEQAAAFTANRAMHPEFADALEEARRAGVWLTALCCSVTPCSVSALHSIPIIH